MTSFIIGNLVRVKPYTTGSGDKESPGPLSEWVGQIIRFADDTPVIEYVNGGTGFHKQHELEPISEPGIEIDINGRPRPQSRPRRGPNGEFYANSNKALKDWRKGLFRTFQHFVHTEGGFGPSEPICIFIELRFRRPTAHYQPDGVNLKQDAPRFLARNCGDYDNLAKPITDEAEKAGVFGDDAQVTWATIRRRWVHKWEAESAKVTIQIDRS